jgi:histone H3/H4
MPRPRNESPSFCVGSRVKSFVSGKGLRTASDLLPALDERVAEALAKACERAKANGRSTVRPQDL